VVGHGRKFLLYSVLFLFVELTYFLKFFFLLQIVKKLVDVVAIIHQAIWEAFGNSGMNSACQNETSQYAFL
jgi:hypothetical protein